MPLEPRAFHPLAAALVATLLEGVVLSVPGAAAAQEPPPRRGETTTADSAAMPSSHALPLLSVDVDLEAYGIDDAGDVGRGRVSVAHAPGGPRLTVYYLRSDPVPPRVTYPDPPPTPEPDPRPDVRAREKALWVWTTAEILRVPEERARFLTFIQEQEITRVFLYLASAEGERPSAGYIPFSSEEVGPLLAQLRDRGALVYALDGDRDYVLEENHSGVFRTVRRLVEHNRSVPAEQRFHGVRYDIEPYLAPGFQGPARQELLDGYVELLAGVSEIGRAGGLAVAVDIPFWFDAPDEETGAYLEATLDGRRARVLEHVMSLVDDLAIMDYRTEAFGANGALAHAYHELRLAEETDVDVFVGVETVRLVDEDLHTFSGPVREGLPEDAEARWIVLEGSADPQEQSADPQEQSADPQEQSADPQEQRADYQVQRAVPEGSGATRARLWLVDSEEALAELAGRVRDAPFLRHWPAGRPIRVAADTQSFRNHGPEKMREVTGEIVRRLIGSPAFAGLAFHDYRGLRELLSGG